MTKKSIAIITTMMLMIAQVFAINPVAEKAKPLIKDYLLKHKAEWKLTDEDISNWKVTDAYTGRQNGITYAYVNQQVKGVNIFNAVSAVSIRNDQVLSFAKRLYSNALNQANSTSPSVTPSAAINNAAAHLGLTLNSTPKQISYDKERNTYTFGNCGISRNNINVEKVFMPVDGRLKLAWNVTIRMINENHWWNIRIDAMTGAFIDKNDWTVHDNFTTPRNPKAVSSIPQIQQRTTAAGTNSTNSTGFAEYRVYALPTEAPSFGPSSLRLDPSDAVASPYGWHDTDGITGAEYTITRGNNVYAYDDIANQDAPGTSPDGTSSLLFDFPTNFSQQPVTYLDASNTNLFYINNMMHDITYRYGFDEDAGNFQENNYGHGGQGADYVHAECQDGGGTDNANFSTPPDGQNGWMQMYLWSAAAATSVFTVNSPAGIAGDYTAAAAQFGPAVTVPITADLVLADDGTAPTSDACTALINGAAMSGKIAVIDRGTCTFVDKVLSAQNAGAIAAIVINNVAGAPIAMPDNGNGFSVTIPSIMISQADGALIKNQLLLSQTVNGTLNASSGGNVNLDGSLDNGVICHEYTHGISTRLTGGPSNSNCLDNGEEGGEGWSDYFALMMTIEQGDQGTDSRGMGTYAYGEPTSGAGIRRYPYSTDMGINPQTYGDLATSSEVHDIGEIWCEVLWDMTWNLIDNYGLDTNWVSGTSGNNVALQLVMEGMKLQPCSPGFLDGRDAILQADDNLYGGIHKCLIWESFARRGMGYLANQGSSQTAGDETEDFSIPPFCQTPTSAPTANFAADVTTTCYGIVHFTDLSTDIPQTWSWDFGDGGTSVQQNPTHTYTAAGNYTVTLTVTNTLGNDSEVKTSYISIVIDPAPIVTGDTVLCSGSTTTLTANVTSGNAAEWYDSSNNLLATGTTYTTPTILNPVTYNVRQITPTVAQHVGPVNGSFGGGGYHNTTFEGQEYFTTFAPLRLMSVWVDASGTADRTFNLYNGSGALISAKTITVPNGQGRVTLNFDIPTPGNYILGVTAGSNLYRNNSGASYPYTINGLVSITQSNSTTSTLTYYYYCYDWEVEELPCTSAPAVVNITLNNTVNAQYTYSATGLDVLFLNSSSGPITSYLWDFGDGNTSTLQNPQHTYAASGTYTVTLIVTSADGCQNSSAQIMTITDIGISELSSDGIKVIGKGNAISISFDKVPENALINIIDELGQTIHSDVFSGSNTYNCTLKNVATSCVFISVRDGDRKVLKKYFISKN